MESLYLWQPTLVAESPYTFELTIAPAESFRVAKGGEKFVRALIEAVYLQMPSSWSVTAFRSPFYSDYLDGAWEDRWALAWALMGSVAEQPKLPNLSDGPVGINKTDETWTQADDANGLKEFECRIIAEFKSEKQARAAADAARKAHNGKLGTRVLSVPKGVRLDMTLGKKPRGFFESGAAEGESLVELCIEMGGATNHQESYRRAQ